MAAAWGLSGALPTPHAEVLGKGSCSDLLGQEVEKEEFTADAEQLRAPSAEGGRSAEPNTPGTDGVLSPASGDIWKGSGSFNHVWVSGRVWCREVRCLEVRKSGR